MTIENNFAFVEKGLGETIPLGTERYKARSGVIMGEESPIFAKYLHSQF